MKIVKILLVVSALALLAFEDASAEISQHHHYRHHYRHNHHYRHHFNVKLPSHPVPPPPPPAPPRP
jgi:hypothetical protein